MIEAALFYEAAAVGLGDDFLDDVQHAIDSVRELPIRASASPTAFAASWPAAFHSASSMLSSPQILLLWRSPISGVHQNSGKYGRDCRPWVRLLSQQTCSRDGALPYRGTRLPPAQRGTDWPNTAGATPRTSTVRAPIPADVARRRRRDIGCVGPTCSHVRGLIGGRGPTDDA
ncbi:MAG: hypothetical protein JWM26_2647 [Betaproteobacteria bacterium]|nr:hypothetical protein [Betaproteobacteria bacterium]